MIGTIFYPAVALIYGVGNWFTFLALIIHVQTQSGAAASAALFLVQTLPALLVAGQIARRIPLEKTRVAWIGCQLVLVALTVPAAFLVDQLWTVYVYAALTMIARAVANPLLMTLVSASVPSPQRARVLRSVSATSAVTLAVAPALGGALLPVLGPTWLLLLNAATFLSVAGVMALNPALGPALRSAVTPHPPLAPDGRPAWFRLPGFASLSRVEGANTRVWHDPYTRLWALLITAGAILNIIEAPLIFDVLTLDETAFGWMLAAYGAGGVIVLVLNMRRAPLAVGPTRERGGSIAVAAVMLLAFVALDGVMVVTAPTTRTVVAVTSFFLLGFAASWLSGTTRSWLDLSATGHGEHRLKETWTWASQVTLAINLVVYLTFFIAYQNVPVGPWLLLPAVIAYIVLLGAVVRLRPPKA